MKAHFERMAACNAWANARALEAAEGLGAARLWEDRGAAFRSVGGTLNHVMVADLIWLARFRGVAPPPFALDHLLHEEMEEIAAARRVLDADICRYVAGLTEAELAGSFTYTTVTDRREVTGELAPALAHLFNHQTHHRGQIHAMLTAMTGSAPAFDLIYFLREAG